MSAPPPQRAAPAARFPAARASALAALALGAFAGCGLLSGEDDTPADSGAAPAAVAHLEQMRGQVVLQRAGKMGHAKLGYLYLKDGLITPADGSANIRFQQGQVVEVGPDAFLTIGEDQTGVVLNVERGLVLTRVPASESRQQAPQARLSILTPFGTTRLNADEGAVQVDVGQQAARVTVLVGAVEVVSRTGGSQQASAGDKVSLGPGAVEIEGRTPAEGEVVLEPVLITISPGGGKAEIKKQGQKRWKPVGRSGEPLGEGDGVRVKSGRSTLAMAGSETRLTLEDATELSYKKAGRQGGVESAAFDFGKGSVSLSLAPGKKSQVELSGLQMESDLGGQFGVVRTKDGYDVQAVAGDLKLTTRAGKETVLLAGQSARVSDKGAQQIAPAERAELVIPTRTGLKVLHPGLAWGALSWGSDAGADYWVEVAFDGKFEQRLLSGLVHSNYVNVPIPRRGALHWRVMQKDRSAEIDRGSAAFAPEPPQRDLARLRNEVQDGAESSAIYFQDKPPAVTFTFTPEEGAAEYRVQVYRASELDKPVVDRKTQEPRLPLEAGALTEGSYVWSVTPLDAKGAELRGGKMNKMQMAYDNSVPNLVINTPRNGDGARGPLRAAGVAPVGARLYVNGKAADLDDKNRFDMVVSPVGRPPVVIFRVSRPPASDTITVRTLRR